MTPKKVKTIKLIVQAGKAGPKETPTLAQARIKPKQFCDFFNDHTKNMKGILSVNIDVFPDGEYKIVSIRSSTVVNRVKSLLGIERGSSTPGKNIIAEIKKSQLIPIVREKIYDLDLGVKTEADITDELLDRAMRTCEGSIKSAGIKVIEG